MCGGANGGCLGAELSRLRSERRGAGAQGCAVGVRDGRQTYGTGFHVCSSPLDWWDTTRQHAGPCVCRHVTCTEVRNAPRDVGQSLARPIRPGTNRRFGGLRVAGLRSRDAPSGEPTVALAYRPGRGASLDSDRAVATHVHEDQGVSIGQPRASTAHAHPRLVTSVKSTP